MKIRNQLLLNYGLILGLMLVVAAKALLLAKSNRQELG
jgi:hypothetical protein